MGRLKLSHRPFQHGTGDIRGFVRSVRRAPGLSITIVLTLVFGIGLASAIFAFADGYLFRPLALPDADRLFYVQLADERRPWLRSTHIEALRASSVGHLGFVNATMAAQVSSGSLLQVDGREVRISVDGVSEGLESIVQVPLLSGRYFTEAEHRGTGSVPVLLVHRFWQREFGGDLGVVGRRFTAQNDGIATEVVVVGVLDPRITTINPEFDPSLMLPDMIAPARPGEPAPNHIARPIVRLPATVTREQAETAIGAALQSIAPAPVGETRRVVLISIHERQTAAGRPMATAFFIGALLALTLVAVNLVFLLLASAATRTREIATRAALGASRWRIARLFLVESLAYGLAGIGGGLVLGRWLATSFAAEIPAFGNDAANLGVVAMTFDARALGFAAITGLIIVLFGGGWPAWRMTRMSLTAGSRPHGVTGGSLSARFSKAILASEVAVSTLVLVGTVFVGVGIWRYEHQPLGFDMADRIAVNLSPDPGSTEQAADWPAVLDAVRRVPGVRAAARFNPEFVPGALFVGDRELERGRAQAAAVGAAYFATWGMDSLAGRWPDPAEVAANAPFVVVDEKLAHLAWPGLDPIGMTVRAGDDVARTVIGVVSHRRVSLSAESRGTVYIAKPRLEERARIVAWAPGLTATELARRLEGPVQQLAPGFTNFVFDVTFESMFLGDLAEVRFQRPILIVLGLFAILVVGVGLFGLVTFLTAQRTRDFGIRIALGAQADDIWRHVAWQSAAPAIVGIAAGSFAAWILERVVEATMFGWESSGPLAVSSVGFAMLLVAALAAIGPARRVLRIDPNVALRAE
jgi:predicted permease